MSLCVVRTMSSAAGIGLISQVQGPLRGQLERMMALKHAEEEDKERSKSGLEQRKRVRSEFKELKDAAMVEFARSGFKQVTDGQYVVKAAKTNRKIPMTDAQFLTDMIAAFIRGNSLLEPHLTPA